MSRKPTLPDEDDYILEPETEEQEPVQSKKLKKDAYRPLNNFARIPAQWLTKPHLPSPFDPVSRLFLYLIIQSMEGRYPVVLTDELGIEIGLSPRTKRKAAARLIKTGWVRVIGHKGHGRAPVLMPLVLTSID